MANGDDWKRLGQLLRNRRGYLGQPSREQFLKLHGTDSKSSLGRIITALENAERDNYDDATLGRIERLYEWREGSIAAVLKGGTPMPIEQDVNIENLLPAPSDSPLAAKRWELVEMVGQVPEGDLDRVRAYLAKMLPKQK